MNSAKHDLDTAETLFLSKKYDWCLFLGHLVLEKTIKAIYAKDNDNQIPPKIHNLVRLADKTTLIAGSNIEPIPFTSADFTEENPFVKEIIQTGIEVSI